MGKVRLRNCTHCGRSGHKGDSTDREKHCPAYGKTCDNCGKKGHFRRKYLSKKIQQKDDGNKQSLVEDEDAEANSVSVLRVVAGVTKDVHNDQPWKVPHMIHNYRTWVECPPPSHPQLNVTLSVAVDGYKRISSRGASVGRFRLSGVLYGSKTD